MLQGGVESEKVSRCESKFKGLRGVSYMKIECLQIEGTRMDSQERILGIGGWDKYPNTVHR